MLPVTTPTNPSGSSSWVNQLLVTLRQRLTVGDSSGTSSASAEVVDLVASPLRMQGHPARPAVPGVA